MLQIDSVSKLYKGGDKALDNISFSVEQGEFISVIGKSGAGKTTLFRLLNGMIKPTAGRIIINNQDFTKLKGRKKRDIQKTIGTIYQDFCLVDTITCLDNVLNGALADRNVFQAFFGIFTKEQKEYARKQLEAVGLSEKMYSYAGKLSGGQKQRVGIARALTTTPDILLCDEATSALDPQTTESILKLLKKINREMGVTILLITHQMQVVQMICNKVAVMENGQVVEAGSVLDVFGKPQAPVTRRFVQTVVNDQIPESILSLVKEQKEHFRVERLKFIGSSVKRPVISDICHVDGIVVNVLGATVQELQENVMCVFILQLIGAEEKILEAEKQIDGNGVIRERVEAI